MPCQLDYCGLLVAGLWGFLVNSLSDTGGG